jgi:electron transfer flavoprotein alpha subunit
MTLILFSKKKNGTVLGKADQILHLGRTSTSKTEFEKIIKELRQDLFR